MTLKVKLTKKLPGFELNVDWAIDGELGVIFGYSAAGKTMTLKMIAGLMEPDEGTIQANDLVLFDSEKGINLLPQLRRIGYVFQDSCLFPHMTVKENIFYGLRDKTVEQGEASLKKMAASFEIEEILSRYPAEISGGQKQRAAFARAMIGEPVALLLDEPFSALDNPIRHKLRLFLQNIHKEYRIPIILVTHDLPEAFTLADKLIIYSHGKVLQTGSCAEVFGNNENPLVKNLVNIEKFCRCTNKNEPDSL
jgi:molybdate transport system ATP-binding protein